jgi:maltose alpha-D-glucosyltransferase/alpha-amylase
MTVAAGARLNENVRPWAIARLKGLQGEAILHDAPADDELCASLLDAIGGRQGFRTRHGRISTVKTAAYGELRGDPNRRLPVERGPATSSNSLIFFGDRLLLKLFRRLEVGVNPDFEIGRFLTETGRFDRVPATAGTLEYRPDGDDRPVTLGILQARVPNQGDGWSHALAALRGYYERVAGAASIAPEPRSPAESAGMAPPANVSEAIGDYLIAAATLGRRTAEMHLALASGTDPDFSPEPLTPADMDRVSREILRQGRQALAALAENLDRLPAGVRDAERLLHIGRSSVESLAASNSAPPAAVKTRIHGDYHLGQVLWVGGDYMILDFEGEPTRSVEERRQKFSPIRDVAGMLRSYHYAAYAGLFDFTHNRPQDLTRLAPWADLWQQWVSAAFLREYLAAAGDAPFLPRDPDEFAGLLDRFTLAKAFYELNYELNNRPDWVRIPLGGVLSLLS